MKWIIYLILELIYKTDTFIKELSIMALMFTILFIFLIGRTHYSLAAKHNKDYPWLWGILGILAYYIGGFVLAVILGVFGFLAMDMMSTTDDFVLNQGIQILIGLTGGLLGTFGLYQYLKHRWNQTASLAISDDILDDTFLSENTSNRNNQTDDTLNDDYLKGDK